MASGKTAVVNKKRCVACGACEAAIKVYCGCYAAVTEDNCVGCGMCLKICPAGSISLKER